MNKVVQSADEALMDVTDGSVIMSGGFGLCGNPEDLIRAINRRGVKDLTVISNNCGTDEQGLGILLQSRQVRKMISSYVGENKEFERQFLSGELDVELVPQGTLAERIRAGGAGIRAFFTPTAVGTVVADGKEVRDFDGTPCVMEMGLVADFSIVKAWKGDTHGNLVFSKTARNFNPMMATAGRVTIAEVEELVPAGELDPNTIHTPGIFVQRVLQATSYDKPIEQRTTRPRGGDDAAQ
jgi:3-oxoacid CoA-transferase A subunit